MDRQKKEEMLLEEDRESIDDITKENFVLKQEIFLMIENKRTVITYYAVNIRLLGQLATEIIAEGHKDRDRIRLQQAQLESSYSDLQNHALKHKYNTPVSQTS